MKFHADTTISDGDKQYRKVYARCTGSVPLRPGPPARHGRAGSQEGTCFRFFLPSRPHSISILSEKLGRTMFLLVAQGGAAVARYKLKSNIWPLKNARGRVRVRLASLCKETTSFRTGPCPCVRACMSVCTLAVLPVVHLRLSQRARPRRDPGLRSRVSWYSFSCVHNGAVCMEKLQ